MNSKVCQNEVTENEGWGTKTNGNDCKSAHFWPRLWVCGSIKKLFPAKTLFTPLKMQMLVINPAFSHLFGGTASCFIKPIYHSGLLNQ